MIHEKEFLLTSYQINNMIRRIEKQQEAVKKEIIKLFARQFKLLRENRKTEHLKWNYNKLQTKMDMLDKKHLWYVRLLEE